MAHSRLAMVAVTSFCDNNDCDLDRGRKIASGWLPGRLRSPWYDGRMNCDDCQYRPKLPMPELIVAIRRLLEAERHVDRLLCRYLADMADQIRSSGLATSAITSAIFWFTSQ